MDYKNYEIAFWLALAFIFTELTISAAISAFSLIIWYLMLNCAMRYKKLGNEITKMGVRTDETKNERKIMEVKKQNLFLRDFIVAMNSHQYIRKY